jgi:hypothetical protein
LASPLVSCLVEWPVPEVLLRCFLRQSHRPKELIVVLGHQHDPDKVRAELSQQGFKGKSLALLTPQWHDQPLRMIRGEYAVLWDRWSHPDRIKVQLAEITGPDPIPATALCDMTTVFGDRLTWMSLDRFDGVRRAFPGTLFFNTCPDPWVYAPQGRFTMDQTVLMACLIRAHGCEACHLVQHQGWLMCDLDRSFKPPRGFEDRLDRVDSTRVLESKRHRILDLVDSLPLAVKDVAFSDKVIPIEDIDPRGRSQHGPIGHRPDADHQLGGTPSRPARRR